MAQSLSQFLVLDSHRLIDILMLIDAKTTKKSIFPIFRGQHKILIRFYSGQSLGKSGNLKTSKKFGNKEQLKA